MMTNIGKPLKQGVAIPKESPVPIRRTTPITTPEPVKEPEKVPA